MIWGLLQIFQRAGYLSLNRADTIPAVATCALLATIVESLPITRWLDDNISVPITAAAAAAWLFQT